MVKLRPYQIDAIRQVFMSFKIGETNVILNSPPGSGKTTIASTIVIDCIKNGFPVVFVVRSRELVKNASRTFDRYKIDHSVFMAGSPRLDLSKKVQVCSADTLNARKRYPFNDEECLLVLDECFPGYTEVMTDSGFVSFEKLTYDHKVAQVDMDGNASFVSPIRYIRKKPNDKLIRFKSDKNIDLMVTKNHQMIVNYNKKTVKIKASEVKKYHKMYSCGMIKSEGKSISWSDRLSIAFQADGTFHSERSDGVFSYMFSFSKQRKIDRLMDICKNGNFKISEVSGKETIGNIKKQRRFIVWSDVLYSKNMHENIKISEIDLDMGRQIIEEMVHWDGSIISDQFYYYSSTVEESVDFYQAVSSICGYSTNKTIQVDNRSDKFSDVHRLFINKDKISFSMQTSDISEVDYSDYVYCVEVPHGNIITRSGGKVVVTGNCHRDYSKVIENYPRGFILGLSGTPFNDEMNKYFHRVISPIQSYELRDDGYLADFITYCPNTIDAKDVSIRAGDFKKDELESLVVQSAIVGDVVKDYIKYGEERPAVCFAVSVEHSKLLASEFNSMGIKAVHCDANSSEKERDNARIGLEDGSIKVVCNVDIFSVGWDCPIVSCIIQARPTWSLIWYLQALGRGNRIHPEKNNCIVIDSAGNVFRHGLFYEPREIELGKEKKKKEYKEKTNIKNCEMCFRVYEVTPSRECPHCGHTPKIKAREINVVSGELGLYYESVEQKNARLVRECKLHFQKLEWMRRKKGILNPNFSINSCIKKYGQHIVDQMSLPERRHINQEN